MRGSDSSYWARVSWLGVAATCLHVTACTGSIDEPNAEAPDTTPLAGASSASAGSGGSVATSAGGGGADSGGGASHGAGTSGAPGTSGASGATGSSGSASTSTSFACNDKASPAAATLRRLTMTQYKNTIGDLVTWAIGGGSAARTILTEVSPSLAALPVDKREAVPEDLHGSYRRLDQTLQQVHVDATYELALAVGAALTTSARLATVVGACATDSDDSNDATCLDSFVKRFGARALRRPLSSDEVDFYKSAYGATAKAESAAYADLIGVFLTAPEFFYFVEHGTTAVNGQSNVYELSAYELASRLSYQLWQTAPDDALLDAAAKGSLLESSTYADQLERMLADPRARSTLDEFFADWMKVEDLPALDAKNQDPVFKAFAGADLPNANLRQAMIEDVIGLLDYSAWNKPAGVRDLFTTELSFAKDARLAKLYGVAAWDGTSAPPALPAGQRPGLLTRALFLSTGTANTRPILKGVFIRKNVLCNEIPPPPPGANAKPPTLGPNMTTRESVEELTEMSGTTCAGCHATLINPLGFATENFDALGRFRTVQRLFDDSGTETGTKPVDTSSVPRVTLDDMTRIQGPSELMSRIASSGQVEACLSRNFFRFTYGRWEDTTVDGCALEDARKVLANGGKLTDMIRAAVTSPAFKRRAF